MQTDDAAISIAERSVMYISAPSYEEYVALASPTHRSLLRSRGREIRVSPEEQAFFGAYPDTVYVLAVVRDGSPDTMAVLPVMAHIANMSARMEFRVLSEESALFPFQTLIDSEELVQNLPEKDLPLFLFLDEDRTRLGQWGPHPQAIEPYLDDWLNRFPEYKTFVGDEAEGIQGKYAELVGLLTYEMRIWYNTCLNDACVKEICILLKGFQETN